MNSITVPAEAIRSSPCLYIGNVDESGLYRMLLGIVDDAVRESLSGRSPMVEVTLGGGGRVVSISDSGRGIPGGEHGIRAVAGTLPAGGECDADDRGGDPHPHVNLRVVNALSKEMFVTSFRDGSKQTMRFERGRPSDACEVEFPGVSGTVVTFELDSEIFSSHSYDPIRVAAELRRKVLENEGLIIRFRDLDGGTTQRLDRDVVSD